jgi:hypothetical protein
MTSGAITHEQVAEAERIAQKAQNGRGVWIFVTIVTIAVSMALNVAHPFVYHPEPDPEAVVSLGNVGLVLLGLLSGLLPVLMMTAMSHAIFNEAPGGVKVIVWGIFIIGMGMSLSAQFEMLLPAVGDLRAAGTVAVIDIPALTALYMIERGNRARKAAERQTAALREAERQAAEQARRDRLAAERRAAEQAAEDERRAEERAAAERLASEQRAAAEAAERAAEAERQAAAERAEAERLATERADAQRVAAERREAAERAEAERLAAEQLAAERRAAAERAAAERMEAQRRAEAERRETERLERERREEAERAERERKEAERAERAARAAERKAAAELAERGDISPAEKKRIIRELWLFDPLVKGPAAVAAVEAKGGKISEQRARAILAEVREEEGSIAEVRPIRQTAAG